MSTKVLLLDGDILVYLVSFACKDETEEYKVLYTARKVLGDICYKSKCSDYLAFLTHSASNFRVPLATTWPYKGGDRAKVEKPEWFDVVRKHYLETGFQMMHGIEADDALTIAAEHYKELGIPVVCATKDKDLKQYPWDEFYDMNQRKIYPITEAEAHRHLWKQMLIGDKATDNIPGLSHAAKYETTGEWETSVRASKDHLIGDKGADALLDSWDPLLYAENTYRMYVDAYEGNEGKTQEVRDTCEDQGICFGDYRFHETWGLIHMLLQLPKGVELHYKHIPVPEYKNNVVSQFKDESLGYPGHGEVNANEF